MENLNFKNAEQMFNSRFFKRQMEANIRHILCFTDKKCKFILDVNSKESYTDGQKIVVGLNEKYANLSIELLSGIIKATTGHEASHVRWSNFDGLVSFVEEALRRGYNPNLAKALANIIEDGRIERLLCIELPGFKKFITFKNLTLIYEDGELEDAGLLNNLINSILYIAKTGLYPTNFKNLFTELEQKTFDLKIKPRILKGVNSNSYKTVFDMVFEILEILAELIPEEEDIDLQQFIDWLTQEYTTSNGEDDKSNDGELPPTASMSFKIEVGNNPKNKNQSSQNGDSSPNEEDDDKNSGKNSGSSKKGQEDSSNNEKVSNSSNENSSSNDEESENSSNGNGDENGDDSSNGSGSSSDEDGDESGDRDGSSGDEKADGNSSGNNSSGNKGDGNSSSDKDNSSNNDSGDDSNDGNGSSGNQNSKSDSSSSSNSNNDDYGSEESNSQGRDFNANRQITPNHIDLTSENTEENNSYELLQEDLVENIKSIIEDEVVNAFENDKNLAKIEEQREKQSRENNTYHSSIDVSQINSNYRSSRQEPNFKYVYPDIPYMNPPIEFNLKIKGLENQFRRVLKNDNSNYKNQRKGRIDASNLWKLSINERDIFSKKNAQDKSDYAVYILIDLSGSMDNSRKYRNAIGTALTIEHALMNINGVEIKTVGFDWISGRGSRLRVFKDFKEKKSRTPYVYTHDLTGHSNRDGFAIRVALEDLKKHGAKNKLLVVISDGMPACHIEKHEDSLADVKDAVHKGRKMATIMSILINDGPISDSTKECFHYMYESKGSIMVDVRNEPENLMNNVVLYLRNMFKKK